MEKGLQLETTGLVACSLDQSFCCSVLITVYRSVFCMHQNKKKNWWPYSYCLSGCIMFFFYNKTNFPVNRLSKLIFHYS